MINAFDVDSVSPEEKVLKCPEGSEVHLQADPTKLELLHLSFKDKKEDFKERDNILEKALEAEDKHRKDIDAIMQIDERKRPYSSLQEVKAPTEEELEAFRMKRGWSDDPMSSFLAKLPPPLPADSPKLSPWD